MNKIFMGKCTCGKIYVITGKYIYQGDIFV